LVKVIVIDLTTKGAIGLGTHELFHLPAIGDWIELNDEQGQGICYDVVQVAIGRYGADVYVTNPRPTVSARMTLAAQFEGK